MDRSGGRRCDVEIGAAVDVLHEGDLAAPVVFIVLNYTECVDPEVFDAKFAGDVYGVFISLRQLAFWDRI